MGEELSDGLSIDLRPVAAQLEALRAQGKATEDKVITIERRTLAARREVEQVSDLQVRLQSRLSAIGKQLGRQAIGFGAALVGEQLGLDASPVGRIGQAAFTGFATGNVAGATVFAGLAYVRELAAQFTSLHAELKRTQRALAEHREATRAEIRLLQRKAADEADEAARRTWRIADAAREKSKEYVYQAARVLSRSG